MINNIVKSNKFSKLDSEFRISFGKNTIYNLDIDDTTVKTGMDFATTAEDSFLKLMDSTDILVFNTGRPLMHVIGDPKRGIPSILPEKVLNAAAILITRNGTNICEKDNTGKWIINSDWRKKLDSTGFDPEKIQKIVMETCKDYKKRYSKIGLKIEESHELYSPTLIFIWPKSHSNLKEQFIEELREKLNKAGQVSFNILDNEKFLFSGAPAEISDGVVIKVLPENTSKGIASEFIIEHLLKKHPHIDRLLVAGDSKGDLQNFLFKVPRKIKHTLFALVDPLNIDFFNEIFKQKGLITPHNAIRGNSIKPGLYTDNVYVPNIKRQNPEYDPPPAGLKNSMWFLKQKADKNGV